MGKRKRMITKDDTGTEMEEQTAAETERPYWQTEPCPSWCWHAVHGDDHAESDGPKDRIHFSRWQGEVTLKLEEPVVGWRTDRDGKNHEYVDPTELEVYLAQQYREVAPRVTLHLHREHDVELNLTLGEARKVAEHLNEALQLVETSRKGSRKLRSA